MKASRRSFITTSIVASLSPVLAKSALSAKREELSLLPTPMRGFLRGDDVVLPPALAPGSTVAITAPASGVDRRELEDGIAFMRTQGLKIVTGKCLSKKNKYLSAPDEERANEFNEFIRREDIDAIMCARGGYGVARILPLLDYNAIRMFPKAIIGYSDITAMLIAIYNKSKVVTYHGPVCSSTFDSTTSHSFVDIMMKNSSKSGQKGGSNDFDISHSSLDVINNGYAEAKLSGGNLTTICSTLGTPYEIDTTDSILFLEDVAEEPYRIDRMLTQLWLAGKLEKVKGVALGVFKSCSSQRISRRSRKRGSEESSNISPSLRDIFEQRFSEMKFPVLAGLPFGHIRSKLTLPLGVHAALDCGKKSIKII